MSIEINSTINNPSNAETPYQEEIYIWADGTWCEIEDVEEFLTFMSDDYRKGFLSEVGEHNE